MASDQIKIWYSLQIKAVPAASEAIEHALNEMNALGTEIDHLRKSPADTITVSGFFDDKPDLETAREQLNIILPVYDLGDDAIKSIDIQLVEQTDWLAEWKKHWKPTTIGRFVITPPWETVDEPDKFIISIEPNMAFGTGTHETTQLCLQAIDENFVAGESFLDVGTGTGILSFAAAKIDNSQGTESRILACDTDTDSVKIAKENAFLNGVGERIEFYEGSIGSDTSKFDFVCANLTIDVIEPILDLLIQKTNKTLLLSGILDTQRPIILEGLSKAGLSNIEIAVSGEWISVLVEIN